MIQYKHWNNQKCREHIVMFKKLLWDDRRHVIQLEADNVRWVHCGYKGMDMVSNNRLWHLNNAQLVLGPNSPRFCSIPPPTAWPVDTRKDRSILSCCLQQMITLPSECYSRNWDSSDQATFFQSSIVQFWWACANSSLSFLGLLQRFDVFRIQRCSSTWCR